MKVIKLDESDCDLIKLIELDEKWLRLDKNWLN
jgi:hypothetical protein